MRSTIPPPPTLGFSFRPLPAGMAGDHGLAFFERRLQRAQAIPEAERSSDVAVFVKSVSLQRQVLELIPMKSDGVSVALPPSRNRQHRVLLAGLLAIRAEYLSLLPAKPAGNLDFISPLAAYLAAEPLGNGGSLAEAVSQFVARRAAGACRAAAMLCSKGAIKLADPEHRRAAAARIDELAAGAPAGTDLPTVQQVQFTLWTLALHYGTGVLVAQVGAGCIRPAATSCPAGASA